MSGKFAAEINGINDQVWIIAKAVEVLADKVDRIEREGRQCSVNTRGDGLASARSERGAGARGSVIEFPAAKR